jgi:ribosome biogenesis GTPase A
MLWINIGGGVELLDTPGVLEPRITDATIAWQLAMCGVLPESAFDAEATVEAFYAWVARHRPKVGASLDLSVFAKRRGMLRQGGEIDRPNAARALMREFQSGKLGRFTFELPGEDI